MPEKSRTQSKSAIVNRLLSREKGATIAEMAKATSWQPHSCRAFLTGLRKTSRIVKDQRQDGHTAYRIVPEPVAGQDK